jgi:hypothetical protein
MGFIDDVSRKVENPLSLTVPFVNINNAKVLKLFSLCNPSLQQCLINNMDSFFNVHLIMIDIFADFNIIINI